ncbi:MAG: LuxR C-terminal-related transcriptional regulator [Anaerovoracaceae bacterium]|nr:LuxR C-terminal-related transcriptional regulator [Anaerovoracaceae bacterium]
MARHRQYDPSARFISRTLRDMMKHTYDYPVTFIGAPPGYGKTVLAGTINDDDDTYRIDLRFNDVDYFIKQLSGIMRSRFSDLADALMMIDDWGKCGRYECADEELYRCMDHALRDVRNSDARIRIVIEDMHELRKEGADVAFMLCRIASDSDGRIHFLITSRMNYWNRYSADVVKGYVCLVIPEMLLFDKNDTVDYLRLCGMKTDRKIVSYIQKKTEGWVMLMTIFVNGYISKGEPYADINMDDYIQNLGIVDGIEELVDFAKQICIMDSFTISQAERFTGRGDAADMIRRMRLYNMYIMYDPKEDSFRFITPYREYLLKSINADVCSGRPLTADIKKDIERTMRKKFRAIGDIMLQDGEFVKAADYYYRAKEFELMMSAIERGRHIGRDEEKRGNYIKYYTECPREIRSRYHLAMLYLAWRFFNFGEIKLYRDASLEFLEDLYSDQRLSEKEKNSLLCDYSIFRAMTDFEDLDKVRQDYENALAVFDGVKRTEHSVIPRTFGSTAVLKLFYNSGSLDDNIRMIYEISDMGKTLTGAGWAGISYEAKAEAAFMRLDLDVTEIMLDCAERECLESPERSMGVRLCNVFLRTRLAIARGEFGPSNDPMKEFTERERAIIASPLKKTADVCRAWTAIQTGEEDQVADWLKTGDFSEVDLLYPAMPSIYLMHIYVLYSMKKYNKVLSYEDMFFGEEPLTQNLVIREAAYLIMASAWEQIGKTYNARESLKKAFELVRSTENMASVVFYGGDLVTLIRQMPEEFEKESEMALKAIVDYNANREKCRTAMRGSRFSGLTKRESQVALCAASGMINREISEKLGISENTVKTTLQRIFSKLDITSRRQLPDQLKMIQE